MNGGQEEERLTNRPLHRVPRRDHDTSSAPEAATASNTENAEAATASNTENADAATVAEQVIRFEAASSCPICLEGESLEDGPLLAFGAACDHVSHIQCILGWVESNGRTCPVCRQGLRFEALGIEPPTRLQAPETPVITIEDFPETGDEFVRDSLRRSTMEEHRSFIHQLGLVSSLLPTPVQGARSELRSLDEAVHFAELWFRKRQIEVRSYFARLLTHATSHETLEDMDTYWIELQLSET